MAALGVPAVVAPLRKRLYSPSSLARGVHVSDEIVFELPDPAYEAYSWGYEDLHQPVAQPPLAFSPADFGEATPGSPPRVLRINGYTFRRGLRIAAQEDAVPEAAPEASGRLEAWRNVWKPQTDRLVDGWLAVEAGDVAPAEWARLVDGWERERSRVHAGVHRETLMPVQRAAAYFVDRYSRAYGQARRPEALDLLQGFENESTARAIALWDLAQLLRDDPGLYEVVRQSEPAQLRERLAESASGRAFLDRFEAAIERHGLTSDGPAMDFPTWREDWTTPIGEVLAFAASKGPGPRQSQDRRRARRESLTAALMQAAASGDPLAEELMRLLPDAQQYLPVAEDHNYLCDQRLVAVGRLAWLSVGRLLRDEAAIESAEDVVFLERDELVGMLSARRFDDRSELVAARRRQHVRNRQAVPPVYLGRPPVDLPTETERLLRDGVRAIGGLEIHGVGVSAGVARGTARVIRSLDEAGRLRQGDILVCGATTQVWTPYFAVVAGVVTNAGGMLSHCAIVAREYGIPCVTGTKVGTRVIRDGREIEIDGATGLVRAV